MRHTLLAFILIVFLTPLIPKGLVSSVSVDETSTYTLYNGSKIGDKCEIVDFVLLCDSFDYNANHLSKVIEHESGYKTHALNPSTKASGIIQFLPSTARGLGTSAASIRKMSFRSQLKLTMKYLKSIESMTNTQIQDSIDMYLAVFHPKTLKQRYSRGRTVIFRRGTEGYRLNSNNDLNRDGDIDIYDVGRLMRYDHSAVDTVTIVDFVRIVRPIEVREYNL